MAKHLNGRAAHGKSPGASASRAVSADSGDTAQWKSPDGVVQIANRSELLFWARPRAAQGLVRSLPVRRRRHLRRCWANGRHEACVRVDLLAHGLKHVRDVAFVQGYADPVLAVLCEPEQTWSGRLAYSMHTCTVTALQPSSCAKKTASHSASTSAGVASPQPPRSAKGPTAVYRPRPSYCPRPGRPRDAGGT